MLKRTLYILLFLISSKLGTAQCPMIYDYLGNLVNKPYFINCQGTGVYNMNFASNSNWGAYTIDWGDGTSNSAGGSYTANSLINHIYNSASPDTFVITLSIPSLGCVLKGLTVMEKPVNASIQIPIGGVTTVCAPKALIFTNSSTDVSETTVFTWNFGDGTPVQTFDYTNSGQTVSHTYNPGTVNCQTAVTLNAKNYCTSIPTIANFNPIQIYDKDNAAITPSALVKCWPDNVFTYTNTTNRNCVPQGNTFQRQEKWNLGNYWGLGHDSIINWRPWPPTSPLNIAYPSVGTYTTQLQDSNLCGVNTIVQSVTIVNPPVAGLIAPPGPFCQGAVITFTNTSATGYLYKWNFGTGGGFVSKPFGTQTFTYNASGTYTVSVIALIGGGGASCTDTEKVVVNILPKPIANFTVSPNKGCTSIIGATFTDLSTSAVSWNWNFGNTNTFNGQIPPAQNYNSIGNFVASLTVTAANTCVHTFTAPISVFQNPEAAFTASNACVGTSASFIDNSTNAAGDPILSWNWNFGDASPTATTSLQNPSHTYTTQNTYTIQLIVNTANCSNSISKNIDINVKPTADFTITPLSGCPTLSVNFTNTSSNATTYNWNFGNGNTSIDTDASSVYTNTTTADKIYTVNLTASTPAGCSDTHTSTVTIFTKPTSSFSVNAPTGCAPVAATFTNNSTGALNYQWTFGDASSSTSTTSILSHTYVNTTLLIQTYTAQLVAINNNGCKDSTTLTVSAYPRPVFNFNMVPNSGCSPLNINFPPVLGAISYQWNFGDGSPLDFSPNPTHIFTNATTVDKTYTVQLIASNAFSCIDTTYGFPIVFAKPHADFVITPTVGCSPLATTFTNTSISGSNYLWKFGDGNTTSTTNTNYTYTNTSSTSDQTFTCSLVAITNNGCRDSLDKLILVRYKPNARFALDTPKCVSKSITFTNNSQGSFTDSWDFGDSSPLSSITNPVHTYTNNTINNLTFSITLITTSSFGCKDTTNAVTAIFAKPIAGAILTPTSGCSPLAVTMDNSSNFAHSYIWKYGDGNTITNTTTNHTYINTNNTTNQTFSCTLIAINNNGCQDSITTSILTFFKPNARFTLDTPKCVSKTITFTNTSEGSFTDSWDFGDLSPISTITNPTHTYENNTISNLTYSVQLISTSIASCKDTTSANALIFAKPVASVILTPTTGCSPLTVGMNNSSILAHSNIWKFGDGNSSSTANINHTYFDTSNIANQTFSCTLIAINNNNGCKDSVTLPILTFFKPDASFSIDTPKCISKTINFLNNTLGSTGNIWDFGDFSTTSSSTNPIHTYTNTTSGNITFTVQLITTTASGCKDTTSNYPVIYAKPVANFALTPTVSCSPLNAVMNNLSLFSTSYLWKYGDGNTSVDFNTNNTYTNTSNSTNQSFNCTLLALNSNGCKDSLTKSLLVLFNPKANFTVDTPGCSPKLLTFTNSSQGAIAYNWNIGTSIYTSTNVSQQFLNSTTTNITDTVQLIASSVNNCRDTITVPFIIHPKPEFTIISSSDSGCTALKINFPPITDVVGYQWNFGEGNISTSDNPSNIYYNNSQVTKTFTIQLIGTNGYGCKDTSLKVIKVFAKPAAFFKAVPYLVYVPTTPVECFNLSSGASSYYWNFGDNNSSTDLNPSHIYQNAGEYQIYLVAINTHGCKDTFELPSKIIAELESGVDIPNAFSPNLNGGNGGSFSSGDVNNDIFHPVVKGIDKYELNIFSRWGELLFVSNDITIGWDGYYKGKLCTQDIYIWKIIATTLDGKNINKTGDLLLLR